MRLAPILLLTIASLAIATNAHADSDGRVVAIVATQPTDGQTAVPIDVVPRVFTEISEEPGDDFYATALTLLRGEEEIDARQRMLLGSSPETAELWPSAALDPATTYTLRIQGSDGSGESVFRFVTFTTGTEKAAPMAGPPKLELRSAQFGFRDTWRLPDGTVHPVEFRATPTTSDPNALSMIRLLNGDAVYGTFIIGGEPLESTVYFYQVPGEEICLHAVQISASGQQQVGDEVCTTSEMAEGGCSTSFGSTPQAPRLSASLALAVALMRRRRRWIRRVERRRSRSDSLRSTERTTDVCCRGRE